MFTEAPVVSFSGGNISGGLIHPNFSPAQAEAIMNFDGTIASINILDPGAYYYSTPEVLVNGTPTAELTPDVDSVLVSWVVITSYGSGGLGFVGGMGSYVAASGGGEVSSRVIAHELGHNFGLRHANTINTLSEKPNSDESIKGEYANPYSVMGKSGIENGGDIMVPGKVGTKIYDSFGLVIGDDQGADVAIFSDSSDVESSIFKDTENDKLPENTFRIYRHDYGAAPLSLVEGQDFILNLPEEKTFFAWWYGN